MFLTLLKGLKGSLILRNSLTRMPVNFVYKHVHVDEVYDMRAKVTRFRDSNKKVKLKMKTKAKSKASKANKITQTTMVIF